MFDLVGAKRRWKLVGLFGLTLGMALVQTVGVASILPFMSLVADPSSISESSFLLWFYENLQFTSERSFLIFVGLGVLAITAFSSAFSAVSSWAVLRFVWGQQYELSVRLLGKYLRQPYSFFLNRNTADLAKNILVEVKEAINGFVKPVMDALSQAIVAICLVTLLVWVDVLLAVISVLVLGGAYGVVYAIVRRQQLQLGRQRLAANRSRFKAASEAFGGIKEIKLLGRERELLKRFSRPAGSYATTNATNAIISQLPRYALETVAFGGILVIVLYILGTRDDIGQAIAIMSLYALAGYRLMPALQGFFAGFAKARFFTAALDNLHSELKETEIAIWSGNGRHATQEAVGFEREIVLDRISFSYPDSGELTLRDITLRIEKNTTIGLAGSTGSGKTTLIDILLGLLTPHRGSVRVDGVTLTRDNFSAWQRRLGYVPQHIYLLDDTVARNIAFGLPDSEIDLEAVRRAARTAHIDEFVSRLPDGFDTVVGERGVRLSGGQRQRIGVARALYHEPDVLVMDEATSALDGITEDAVMDAIRGLARHKTIILIAHRLITLRDCDVIYFLDRGEVSDSGRYHELIETNSTFRAMARGAQQELIVS